MTPLFITQLLLSSSFLFVSTCDFLLYLQIHVYATHFFYQLIGLPSHNRHFFRKITLYLVIQLACITLSFRMYIEFIFYHFKSNIFECMSLTRVRLREKEEIDKNWNKFHHFGWPFSQYLFNSSSTIHNTHHRMIWWNFINKNCAIVLYLHERSLKWFFFLSLIHRCLAYIWCWVQCTFFLFFIYSKSHDDYWSVFIFRSKFFTLHLWI